MKYLPYLMRAVCALFSLWVLGFVYFLGSIPRTPDPGNIKTDAIVVLTGGEKRVEEGMDLLRKQKAQRLFISGVNPKVHEITEITHGMSVDSSKIELGKSAETTADNALESKAWVQKNHIKSIRLVTANYHMVRSMLEFKHTLPYTMIIPNPVFPTKFDLKDMWRSYFTLSIAFSEYNKVLYSWYKHYLGF